MNLYVVGVHMISIDGHLRSVPDPARHRAASREAYVMQKDEFFATETPREAILKQNVGTMDHWKP